MITAAASAELVSRQQQHRLVRAQHLRTALALRRLAAAVSAQERAQRRLDAARSRATGGVVPA